MQHYESIFRYLVNRQAGYCWLRLYQRSGEVVVLLGEVPGNSGVPVSLGIRELAAQVVARFRLEPTHLTWIEYYPPDALSESWGEYRQVHLTPSTRVTGEVVFQSISWENIARQQVEYLIGSFLHKHPFWRTYTPDDVLTQWVARVAGRTAQVWQGTEHDSFTWRALVQGRSHELTLGSGELHPTRLDAQRWALCQLAVLAQEFDTLPAWAIGQP